MMIQLKYDPTDMEGLKALLQAEAAGEQFDEITMQKVIIGKDIIARLPGIMNGIAPVTDVLVVTDAVPIKYGQVLLRDAVCETFQKAGIRSELIMLAGENNAPLHADMKGVAAVQSKLAPGMGIAAIGGGTITDICKYASLRSHAKQPNSGSHPFVVCQSATSGSAFGANQAVILKEGVKRTLKAVYPHIVVVDRDVIASAPRAINIAGFGDMLGILISSVDWHVAHMLEMSESYSRLLVAILQDSGEALLKIDRLVGGMSPEGLEVLAKVLLMMGIVSSMGHGTAPISGFDHIISHALDFEGVATGRALSLHGSQVGLGAAYASVAYQYFLDEFSPATLDPDRCYPSEEQAMAAVAQHIAHLNPDKKAMDELWSHYSEKLVRWQKKRPLFERFLADWDKPQGPRDQIAARLKTPEKIIQALFLSGNPALPEQLSPSASPEQMRFAFLSARFMRQRFTIADIMGFCGILDDAFWKRVDAGVRKILSACSA